MSEDAQGIWGGFTVFGTLRLTGDPGFCRFSGVQRRGLWVAPNSAQKSLLFFFFFVFFFPPVPDLGCSVLQGCCCSVWGPEPPTLLTPELPKCTFHLPQTCSTAPCPGTPALLPPSPWHFPPFLFPISSASARPLLTFCPHTLCCGISETEIQTVFLEILRWCLQTAGLCCIRITCTQEWKASFPQTCLLPK